MNELIVDKNIKIEDLIYEIRGKYVMLDSDLAKLYNCKNGTKSINLAVKRHANRFPQRFMFQLTEEESRDIWFQIETKNNYIETRGGKYHRPYVFTEQGVAMLSSVLKTDIAEKVSVKIMDAFVYIRKYINYSLIEQEFYKEMLIRHDNDIKLLQKSFDKLSEKEVKNEIYFNGQIYDSYSKIIDIVSKANNELIIIDAYADKVVLDIISKLNAKVILITSDKTRLTKLDIEKYNSQYKNLKIVYDNTFHDRYFILDRNILYHSGTSLNYIGTKTFSINKIEDDILINSLINRIEEII